MRRVAAIETCFALLLALFLAPFEHIHTDSGSDHDHGLIHAHFYDAYHAARPASGPQGPQITDADDDDHATAKSLDTFTLVLPAGVASFLPERGPALAFVASLTFVPVRIVEQRGHDPPAIDKSIPRAPPS
jgi:hypothetical protein